MKRQTDSNGTRGGAYSPRRELPPAGRTERHE